MLSQLTNNKGWVLLDPKYSRTSSQSSGCAGYYSYVCFLWITHHGVTLAHESYLSLWHMPQALNGQNQLHQIQVEPNTSHVTLSHDACPALSHDTRFNLWHLNSCKYSADHWPVSRETTRLRQFNTNYFHLTGSTIKTVSPSDWDSCLCASCAVTPIARNYHRLCFARCLAVSTGVRRADNAKLFISQFSPPSAKPAS